ncbi:zinc-alpha-2-glycoprotein-like [Tenrec ecaudatus]|uniref:zinc-alpha-2-glycoprotein-like n=1 Tax=Tenrec ecaudatus TaxID=94439 RepID=UPI003F59B579
MLAMSAGLQNCAWGSGRQHAPRPALPLPLVLLLASLGTVPSGSLDTPHSLRYDFLALSQPGPGQGPYEISGYLGEQPFLWCCKEGRWAEPRAPWAQASDQRFWEKLILRLKARAQHLVIILRSIMERNNQSQGAHALQSTVVCELLGNQSSWGHWRYSYDGQNFLLSTLESVNSSTSRDAAGEKRKEQVFLTKSCIYPLRKYVGAAVVGEQPPTEPPGGFQQLPAWIFCGVLASAVLLVGASGTYLWKHWKKVRRAGMQGDTYIPMSS